MLSHYLKIFIRNFRRYAFFSCVNLGGLSIGIMSSIFILHFVVFELSYDDFNVNQEQIFRVLPQEQDESIHHIRTQALLGPSIVSDIEGVQGYVRFSTWGEGTIRVDDAVVRAEGPSSVYITDNSIFDIFTYPVVKGDAKAPLVQPFSAVMTESMSKKVFGDTDPIGRRFTYQISQPKEYHVTAVIKDLPENSNMHFEMLLNASSEIDPDGRHSDFDGPEIFETYILLNKGTDPIAVTDKIIQLNNLKSKERPKRFELQALDQIHLHSAALWEPGIVAGARGDIRVIYFLIMLAASILSVTWINFVNMTTVRSIDRSKEVGLSKVLGATRGQLTRQFIFESIMFNSLAVIIALALVASLFNQVKETFHLDSSFLLLFFKIEFLILLLFIFIFGIIFSGVYPAIATSSVDVITALKGIPAKKKAFLNFNVRTSLLVFQYCVSVILIAGTFTIFRQIKLMTDSDLGIGIDNIILITNPTFLNNDEKLQSDSESFKKELLKMSGIENFSLSNFPGEAYFASSYGRRKNGSESQEINIAYIDYNFVPTYEVEILAGRNLKEEVESDKKEAILINESATELYGFESPEEAVGQQIIFGRWGERTIVGVIRDYHQEYLRKPVKPTAFLIIGYSPHLLSSIKTSVSPDINIINTVQAKFNQFFPNYLFQYRILRNYYSRQYISEVRFGKVCGVLSLLAVFLSCVGLYAVSGYSILQKFKEIGMRKVLGASTQQIAMMLLKSYTWLIVVSCLIAFPLAYLIFTEWLESFATRVDIGIEFFLLPVLIVAPIILITVGYNVVKAASSNPIEILKYE